MRARRPGGIAVAEVLFLVLLLVPPALRLVRDHTGLRDWLGAASRRTPVRDAEVLRAELAATRDELREAHARLESLRDVVGAVVEADGAPSDDFAARFRAVGADIVGFSDPSPRRHALWLSFQPRREPLREVEEGRNVQPLAPLTGLRGHGSEIPRVSCAVVSGKRLVGRLVPSPAGFSIARVQSLRDPLFRVRFRVGDVTGMLWGTGLADGEGHALLEVHHRTRDSESDTRAVETAGAGLGASALSTGVEVVTAGNDGVFPPGILIGETVPGADASRVGGKSLVRAALDPAFLERVVVVVDRTRVEFAVLTAGESR